MGLWLKLIIHTPCDEQMADCKKCNGSGQIPCETCLGGQKEVPCTECGGDRFVIKPHDDKYSPSSKCQGEGTIDLENCSECHGDKQIGCTYCYGTGEMPDYSDEETL